MIMRSTNLMPLASGRYLPHPKRGGRASPMLQLQVKISITFSAKSDDKKYEPDKKKHGF